MKTIFGASFAIIALCINITPAIAAVDWNSVPANEVIKTINTEVEKTQNVQIDSINASYVYKKITDKKTLFYSGYSQSGVYYPSTNLSLMSIGSSTYSFEMGKSRPKTAYSMGVISDGTNIYFKINELKNKSLRNSWIKANGTQYDAMGNGLHVPELFSAFDTATNGESKTKTEKISAAYNKTQFWQKYSEAIDDDFSVNNATRYNFEPKQSAIKPYFEEIQNTMTLKEMGYGSKYFKDLLDSLSNDEVTEFIANNSYLSVWIDNASKLPVRIINIQWIPVTEKKKTVYVLNFSDIEFKGYNSQPKIAVPPISTDATLAAKLLKIKL